MHADKREEIDSAERRRHRGHHGHRLRQRRYLRLASTNTARWKACSCPSRSSRWPSIPLNRDGADKLGKALARFRKEDPTFRVSDRRRNDRNGDRRHGRVAPGNLRRADPPRIQRRGRSRRAEGQLPRSRRPKRPNTTSSTRSKPAVRASTPISSASSNRCPKTREEIFEFEDNVVGGRIPREYIPVGRKGLPRFAGQGAVAEFPIVGVKAILEDGSYHDVDSSDMAFQTCARNCFRETFLKTKPVLLEPIMKVEIEVPSQYPGPGGRRADQPPRPDRLDRSARATWPRSKAKCRWPKRSATRPTCAA